MTTLQTSLIKLQNLNLVNMKKYILGLIALAFSFSVSAQVIPPLTGTPMVKAFNTNKLFVTYDTVTNTGTNYLTNKLLTSGIAQTVSIEWTGVKLSGTVAGTVTLQASMDGLNFFTLTGNATVENTTIAAFTATNVAAQSTGWTIKNNPWPWYRVSWTGTGTMVATQSAVINAH